MKRLSPAIDRARARLVVLLVAVAAAAQRAAADLFTLAGGLLVAIGAGCIAVPAGLIVGGVFLAAYGIALDLSRARAAAPPADPRERG